MVAAVFSMRDLGVRPSRSLGAVRDEGSRVWEFARWSGGVTLLDAVEARMYAFVAAAAVGLTGPAALEIARTILSPTNVVVFPVLNLLMPLSGRLFLGQGPALRRVTLQALTVTGVVASFYGLLAAIGADVLVTVLYGERYADVTGVVRLFCAYHVLASVSVVASVSLESVRRPRAVFFAQLWCVMTGLLVAWLSVETLGIAGAVVGMIAGSIVGLTGKVVVLARGTVFASRPRDVAMGRV